MESDLAQPILNFAVDIYKRLLGKDDNVFYSPFSIAAALFMTLPGTRGKTAKEIATALHVREDAPVHESFSKLHKSLMSTLAGIELNVANRIYCEREFQPLRAFCALLEEFYSATIESVDFKNDAENVRHQINAWVEEVTKEKIKDLLGQGSVSMMTLLVLVNAVYFKGSWKDRFEENLTSQMEFHETSSTTSKVDMMFQKGSFRMGHNSELKVATLELPYKGDNTYMVILLPDDTEGLKFLEERVTLQNVSSALSDMKMESDVQLYLPKFKVEYKMALKEVLEDLCVKDMFDTTADLTGITDKKGVKFSDAVHKAFVDVNEEGTEAAAATATMMLFCCSVPYVEPKVFRADHPFMFFIITRDPNVVLFVGSLRHP